MYYDEKKMFFNTDQGHGIHTCSRSVNGMEVQGVYVGAWDYIPKESDYFWIIGDKGFDTFGAVVSYLS